MLYAAIETSHVLAAGREGNAAPRADLVSTDPHVQADSRGGTVGPTASPQRWCSTGPQSQTRTSACADRSLRSLAPSRGVGTRNAARRWRFRVKHGSEGAPSDPVRGGTRNSGAWLALSLSVSCAGLCRLGGLQGWDCDTRCGSPLRRPGEDKQSGHPTGGPGCNQSSRMGRVCPSPVSSAEPKRFHGKRGNDAKAVMSRLRSVGWDRNPSVASPSGFP